MIDLPDHIIRQIVRHSRTRARISLACTCSSLQPFAEERLWSAIDFTLYPPEAATSDTTTSCKAMCNVVEALKSRPERQKLVKFVKAAPTKYDIEHFTRLILLLSDTLQSLYICPSDTHLLHNPNSPFSVIEQAAFIWSDAGLQFNTLEHFRIPLDDIWRDVAQGILLNAPNLKLLKLLRGGTDLSPLILPDDLHLGALTRLGIEYVPTHFVDAVVKLFGKTPCLERVSLVGITGPGSHIALSRRIVRQLGKCPCLRTLSCSDSYKLNLADCGFMTLQKLDFLSMYTGCYAASIEEIEIPSLPNLLTLHEDKINSEVLLRPRCVHYSEELQETAAHFRVPIVGLSAAVVSRIFAAPRLHTIVRRSNLPTPTEGAEVEQCARSSTSRRVFEHVYVLTIEPEQAPDLEMVDTTPIVWCRTSSHRFRDEKGKDKHLREMVIQDWVNYGGRKLERHELDALCDIVGLKRSWGGEGQRMIVDRVSWRKVTQTLDREKALMA